MDSFFDRIFVINLDSRRDRWEKIVVNLRKHGIRNYERFSAIRPTADMTTYQQNWYETYCHLRQHGLQGTDTSEAYALGCLGCKLSHSFVLQLAWQRGYQRILILEDDAELLDHATSQFPKCVQTLPSQWNVLYLMANHVTPPQQVSDSLAQVTCSATTGGYAVQRHMIPILLDALQQDVEEIDVTYTKVQSQIPMYCCKPHLARQRPGYSDIRRETLDYSVFGT